MTSLVLDLLIMVGCLVAFIVIIVSAIPLGIKQRKQGGTMKAGWKTTEFWGLIFTKLIGLGVAFGVVSQTDATSLQGNVTNCLTAVSVLVVNFLSIKNYIANRTALKIEAPIPQPEPPMKPQKLPLHRGE